MYYILNYVPFAFIVILYSLNISMNPALYLALYLLGQPIYLLTVNIRFVLAGKMTYVKSLIYMLSAVILGVVFTIVEHKIRTGYFMGDVPEGLYCLMAGIPAFVIAIGMAMTYIIKKLPLKKEKKNDE